MATRIDQLWSAVESYVTAEHVELDDLEVLGAGGGGIVRVTLDGDDMGVDRIAEISRGLSRVLDDMDPFETSYTLEVTSPGLERKLRRPVHYKKSIGRTVKVKTLHAIDGVMVHIGELVSAGADECTLEIDGERRIVDYSVIASARTVFVWEKNAKSRTRL